MYSKRLAQYTTLRVGGPCKHFVETSSSEDFIAEIKNAEARNEPLLVLGEGSNIVAGDEPFEGTVIRPLQNAVSLAPGPLGFSYLTAQAGCHLDDIVERSIQEGLCGLEALSGIPGCLGSAIMQNVGAYGSEIASAVQNVTLFDRKTQEEQTWGAQELGFGYRTSAIRTSLFSEDGAYFPSPRWIVKDVTFCLKQSELTTLSHAQLSGALHKELNDTAACRDVREAVLTIRASKGMLKDPDPCCESPMYDRWSTGSFFTNPVLDALKFTEKNLANAPRYETGIPNKFKTSAAWLIEHAGFPKGYGVHDAQSKATLSQLHTLALTNRGEATAEDIAELARVIRTGVFAKFGILLDPESILIGIEI